MLIEWSSPEFIYLFAILLLFTSLPVFKFIQCLYAFLKEPVKFWWGSMFFFWRFTISRCFYYVLIFYETLLPGNVENYSWREYFSLIFICRAGSRRFSAGSTRLLVPTIDIVVYTCQVIILWVNFWINIKSSLV